MCVIQNESVSPFKALLSPRVSFWNFPNFLLRHQNTVPSDRVSMYSNRNDFKTIPPPGLSLPMALNALLETAFIGTAGAAPQSPLFLPPSLPSASDVDLRPPPADRSRRRASPPLSLPPSQTAIGEALSRQGFRRRRQRERASERAGISWRVRTIPLTRLHFLSSLSPLHLHPFCHSPERQRARFGANLCQFLNVAR